MSCRLLSSCVALALSLGALGCQDQAYVSPNTVLLSITNTDTGVERVNRCNYIPILLGSQVKARYEVEDDLKAVISLTRDDVTVSLEGGDSWVLNSSKFDAKLTSPLELDSPPPPSPYKIELDSFCQVDDN